MELSVLESSTDNYYLPGKPLTADELIAIVIKSRNSGAVTMEDAHNAIRNTYPEG
ncbi:hypothetical protein [Parasediminibacterium sp. JCM 36343]|uniref:hypothetical protein n=1 Tax=Parasediminibacterium sp. JCM 36343 TaxID=3374279 RepID=UPI00397C8D9C